MEKNEAIAMIIALILVIVVANFTSDYFLSIDPNFNILHFGLSIVIGGICGGVFYLVAYRLLKRGQSESSSTTSGP
ncbi:MAG: hypothetical protein GTN76_11705 [Candidatus Aenigmarchaeota archaeon]|nr:hypothetical protein [Candidatus Aenigmarchaeota archaeon]NIQ18094.1 hypothetical protein [Candidatus Aenigmarchaeota archaeon]